MCYLATADARIVAESHGPGANLQAVGELAVEEVLHGVMDHVLRDRRIVPAAICLGMAGVDRRGDAETVQRIMRRIGYNARVVVTNDALIALVAGIEDRPGVVIVAGTGSIAYGRDTHGYAARAGGWGYILGDEGGGYWIGRHAVRAVLRQADRRGGETALTALVLDHFRVRRPAELIHSVYTDHLTPAPIAAVAPLVQIAAEQGDEAAIRIIQMATTELFGCATSVVGQLALSREAFTFVLSGGVFRMLPTLTSELSSALAVDWPDARVMLLDREPAHGALSIALATLRGRAPVPAYRTP